MSTNLPSFDRAEYTLAPNPNNAGPDQCARCQQPLEGSYYRINGDLACESCAQQATPAQLADSHAAFSRAILYGIGDAAWSLTSGTDPGAPGISGPFSNRPGPAPSL